MYEFMIGTLIVLSIASTILFGMDWLIYDLNNTKSIFNKFIKKETKVEKKSYGIAQRFNELNEYKKLLIQVLDDISFNGYGVGYNYQNWYIEEGISGSIIIKRKLSNYRDILFLISWEINDHQFKINNINFGDKNIRWKDNKDIHKYGDIIYDMYVSLQMEKDKTIIEKFNKFKNDVDKIVSKASQRDSKINEILGEN
jgi:hypothetical protein